MDAGCCCAHVEETAARRAQAMEGADERIDLDFDDEEGRRAREWRIVAILEREGEEKREGSGEEVDATRKEERGGEKRKEGRRRRRERG